MAINHITIDQAKAIKASRSPKLSPEMQKLLNIKWEALRPAGSRLSVSGFEIDDAQIAGAADDGVFSNTGYKIFYQHKLPGEIYY
mgnify:CR=1 FL=1